MTAFHVGPDLIHWRGLSESPDTGRPPGIARTRPRRGSPLGARASPRRTPARAPSDPGRDPSRESRDMSAALNDIIRDELTFTPRGAGGWATGLAGSGRDAATGERDCGKRRRTRTGTGDGRGSRPPPPACASPVPATSSQQRVAGGRASARENARKHARRVGPFFFPNIKIAAGARTLQWCVRAPATRRTSTSRATLEGSTPADGGSGFYYNLDTMNCINGEPCRPSRMPSSAACRRLSSS